MKSIKRWITVPVLATLFLLAIPSATPHVYGAAAPCVVTSPPCSIKILSPGGTLNSNTNVNPSFIVSFQVTNFTLVQPGGSSDFNTTNTAGRTAFSEGHIHVFVDNVYITLWTSGDGIPLTVTPGTHTVRLDLVNDLHQEFSPGKNASTTVTASNLNTGLATESSANSANTNASNAMLYSLGALAVSVVTLILVAYTGFRPRKSM